MLRRMPERTSTSMSAEQHNENDESSLVDTDAFYAALNRRDSHHHDAVGLFERAMKKGN